MSDSANAGDGLAAAPTSIEVRDLIYVVRGKQVMLDSDLAELYGVETGALNRAAKRNEERFEQVFGCIEGKIEPAQRIFFDGQIYDAFSLLTSLVEKAEHEIVLVDGYVDVGTLNILAKKDDGVAVALYTKGGGRLSQGDIDAFNAQYPPLEVHRTDAFHDRFLILDGKTAYHIGASLKDAGRKAFAITLIEDDEIVEGIMARLGRICLS